jgi:hypothetical protein
MIANGTQIGPIGRAIAIYRAAHRRRAAASRQGTGARRQYRPRLPYLIRSLTAALFQRAGPRRAAAPASPSPADDGAGEGEEGLVDVVVLNVVRRTAMYSCRLRLPDDGTRTARSMVITAGVTCRRLGVPAPAVRQKAFDISRPWVGVSRREGIIGRRCSRSRLAGRLPWTSRSLLADHPRVPAADASAARGRPVA